jgi:peptide/nickel transport system permease protein
MAAETTIGALAGARRTRRLAPRWLRSLLRARLAAAGVVILLLVSVSAAAAPLLAPHDPRHGELMDSNLPPAWQSPGMRTYALGTDTLGRDILSRLVYGARISLAVGFSAVAIAGALGITVGLVAGYYRGRVDDVFMRLADIQLAVPSILFALAILAVLGPGLRNLILTLGITGWVTYARVVRGQVLSFREKEFVEAARALGVDDVRIMFRHILPNTFASLIVIASFAVAATILTEASLSFLGLGVPPDVPTWGGMVADGREQILNNRWWMYVFPGVAIMLTVLAINSVGDWLRDFLDPRLRV